MNAINNCNTSTTQLNTIKKGRETCDTTFGTMVQHSIHCSIYINMLFFSRLCGEYFTRIRRLFYDRTDQAIINTYNSTDNSTDNNTYNTKINSSDIIVFPQDNGIP